MDKIKITKKEIEEMYDITDDGKDSSPDKGDEIIEEKKNFTFEEHSEYFDKKELEEDAS